MALIKPIHGEMKGSIGGNTWQGGKFGQVVRQRRKPVNPNSPAQSARRRILAALNVAWKQITQEAKDAFDEYAQNTPMKNKFGDPTILTGRQMFIRINGFTVGGGGVVNGSAPVTPGMAANPDVSIGASEADGLEIDNYDVGGGTDDLLQVQFAGPFASSKQKHKGPWRGTQYINSDTTSPHEILPASEMTDGQVYFVQVRYQDPESRLSEQFLILRVVVPTPLP